MPPSTPRAPQRIAKLLARAGIASRREVERMIADGRIALNGVVLDTPATILTTLAGVTVDGDAVAAAAPARLFRFHKPPGLLTTERDPAGRPTIYDRLPADLPRVMPVGRLDMNTEGLLLMTTDGELKRQLELPATGVERSYRARAYGPVTQEQLESLMLGIEIDGIRYGPINANLERRTGANTWIEMTLTEGKNREVRRVLEHLGLEVSRLIRTRYGPFILGDLNVGDVDEIRQHDLVAFRKSFELPDDTRNALRIVTAPRPPKPVAVAPAVEPDRRMRVGRPQPVTVDATAPHTPRPGPVRKLRPDLNLETSLPVARPARGPSRPLQEDRAPKPRSEDSKPAKWGDRARTGRARAVEVRAEREAARAAPKGDARGLASRPPREDARPPRGEARNYSPRQPRDGERPPRGEGRPHATRAPRDDRPQRGDDRPPRGEARSHTPRPPRDGERPPRGDARPITPRSLRDDRPQRSDARPANPRAPRSDARPPRSDDRPTRSDARPPRDGTRPARSPRDKPPARPGGKPPFTGKPKR